jgi:hypothetical protein
MIELMHPDELLDYAREHHQHLLRLVETDRALANSSSNRLKLRERILMGLDGLLFSLKFGTRSTEVEVDSSSTCEKVCVA